MSTEPDNAADLLQRIAETAAIIDGAAPDTADPEVREMLAEAYRERALAFSHLGRHVESADDWDSFLRIWSEIDPDTIGNYARLRAEALDFRGYSLRSVGRRDEAQQLDAQLIEFFSHATDPVIERRVDRALARRVHTLLRQSRRVSEALAVSDRLLGRFGDTAEDDLADRADLLLTHARTLLALYGPGVFSIARASSEMAMNSGAVTVNWLSGTIDARLPIPLCREVTVAIGQRTPAMLVRHRRRVAQARDVVDAVRTRLRRTEDPDLLVLDRRARILGAYATMFLGRPQEGFSAFWDFEAGNDPAAVRAFAEMAAEQSRLPGWLNQLGTAGLLGMRAHALVGDDPRLKRIAYDDSVAAHLPDQLSAPVRLALRLLRPADGHAAIDPAPETL